MKTEVLSDCTRVSVAAMMEQASVVEESLFDTMSVPGKLILQGEEDTDSFVASAVESVKLDSLRTSFHYGPYTSVFYLEHNKRCG